MKRRILVIANRDASFEERLAIWQQLGSRKEVSIEHFTPQKPEEIQAKLRPGDTVLLIKGSPYKHLPKIESVLKEHNKIRMLKGLEIVKVSELTDPVALALT